MEVEFKIDIRDDKFDVIFKRILDLYKKNHSTYINKLNVYYRNCENLEDAIHKAGHAYDVSGKRHGHQRRIKKVVLEDVTNKLKLQVEEIKDCSTFSELYEIVRGCKCTGFGELSAYDCTFRIGAYLGLYPDKVYLHAGVLKGAKNLALNCKRGYILREHLPKCFQALTEYEIEDLMCIYKAELKEAYDLCKLM
jgi:hypothetical protein